MFDYSDFDDLVESFYTGSITLNKKGKKNKKTVIHDTSNGVIAYAVYDEHGRFLYTKYKQLKDILQ